MNETAVYGKSYWEIVVQAFRKNASARAGLWVSVAMLVVASLTPLLANDRPYGFYGTMPGEYRKAYNQATRGAFVQLMNIPNRLREEQASFQERRVAQRDFLSRVSDEELRAVYGTIERLRKRAEAMPAIRGLWISREVTLEAMFAEMTPEEKAPFKSAIDRILRDLPEVYRMQIQRTLTGFGLKLREMEDQLDSSVQGRALLLQDKLRNLTLGGFLTSKGEHRAALQGLLDEVRAIFDPNKVTLIPKTRFPLLDSLDTGDVFFAVSALTALLTLGPLTWITLKRITPLERRWGISWTIALVPAVLIAIGWKASHDVKFESVSYKRGVEDGSVLMQWSIWPIIRYRYDEVPDTTVTDERRRPPTPPESAHLLGTDYMGRDLLSRMLWGSRISLSIGFVSSAIAVGIGIVLGAMAGYYGKAMDIALSRFIEVMICFPSFFIILAVVAFLPPNILYVMLVLGVFGWMGIARLQRGEYFRLMGQDFVVAARALGASNLRVMFRHVLPNAIGPVLVAASFQIASAMLIESGLSFLGFGVQEPATSWGQILFTGRGQLDKWWTFVIPGAAIFVAVTCYNLVGDGIRDAVDPRLKT